MDRTFISHNQIWLTIYITIQLKCTTYWKQADTMWSLLSGCEVETVWGWQIAVPMWWGQGYPWGIGYCICMYVLKSWNCFLWFLCLVSIISLQKSGQLNEGEKFLKTLSSVSDKPLDLVGAWGRYIHPRRCRHMQILDEYDSWYLFA